MRRAEQSTDWAPGIEGREDEDEEEVGRSYTCD